MRPPEDPIPVSQHVSRGSISPLVSIDSILLLAGAKANACDHAHHVDADRREPREGRRAHACMHQEGRTALSSTSRRVFQRRAPAMAVPVERDDRALGWHGGEREREGAGYYPVRRVLRPCKRVMRVRDEATVMSGHHAGNNKKHSRGQ